MIKVLLSKKHQFNLTNPKNRVMTAWELGNDILEDVTQGIWVKPWGEGWGLDDRNGASGMELWHLSSRGAEC